jgi:hypothetical protein
MLPPDDVKTPRDRYVAACQFYIAVVSVNIHDANKIPKPVVWRKALNALCSVVPSTRMQRTCLPVGLHHARPMLCS